MDAKSGLVYLVDTGAEKFLLPPFAADRRSRPRVDDQLITATGSSISTWGSKSVSVSLDAHAFAWDFVIADVREPIISANFLAHHALDVGRRLLVNLTTLATYRCCGASCAPIRVSVVTAKSAYKNLLNESPELMELRFNADAPRHGVKHFVETTGPPVFSRSRRLALEKLRAVKAEFMKLVALGGIRPSKSPWSSPLHIVVKPDGSFCPCGDYRRLNIVTTDDKYPMRTLQDFAADLDGKSIFSKIDLVKGYHQVPMADGDIAKPSNG